MVAGSGGGVVSFTGKELLFWVVCSVSIGRIESSEPESESESESESEDEEPLDDGARVGCAGRAILI